MLSVMSFDLKITKQSEVEFSPQQKKLNRLIENIEQKKRDFLLWQQAKEQIQQASQKHFMPVYRELYVVLFEQMQQLWQALTGFDLNKSAMPKIDEKIYALARLLKASKLLDSQQLDQVDELYRYYSQAAEYAQQRKNNKAQNLDMAFNVDEGTSEQDEYDDFEPWNRADHTQAREQAKLKRQQEKQAKAEKLVNQSLKTVYLKIASIIHPDREQDEAKKMEKTEHLQRANEAYEQEDLFFLLKLQLAVEQSKSGANKALTVEQVKFYQQALEAQSLKLQKQINALIDSLVWSEKAKITLQKSKGQLKIQDLYKQLDADISALKQQLKAEKQRLIYMGKESGLEMLLEQGLL